MSRNSRLMPLVLILTMALLVGLTGSICGQTPVPPKAAIIPKIDTTFDDIRVDNYYWLRERDNPQVMAYLKAENQYTEEVMRPTEATQEKLFSEMRGRIKETDMTVPTKTDSFYYYKRTLAGQQYGLYCRRLKTLDAPEEILLDENRLAAGHGYFHVGTTSVSYDHKTMAYAVDTTGREIYTMYFKDLITGQTLPEAIPDAVPSAVWATDGKTVFYTTQDDILRPYKLFRHVVGTDPAGDVLVYHELDEEYNVAVNATRDRKYLIMDLEAIAAVEVRYLPADVPSDTFRVILPRQKGVEYYVDHHDDYFYIRANTKGKNFGVYRAPVDSPTPLHWTEVIAPRDSVMISDLDLFRDFMVVYERAAGQMQVQVRNLRDGSMHQIAFPEPIYQIWPTGNSDFNTDWYRFSYTSLVTPLSLYDYNMTTRERTLLKQYEVMGGYDPTQYVSERLFARAADGALVPISLVYKKGLQRDGSHPLYLYGYGAYGFGTDPRFSSSRLSLLDRGFVYAIAHVRGGDEMGRDWYDKGKLFHKKNTFTDFIACAEKLIADGYTSKDRLVANGASAGGLVMGVIANLRPDLFRIIVADVPFVDVINTMLDASIPLTINEYDEWGNPNQKDYYEYMRSYSPYDNVKAQAYPTMLITGSLNDASVQYWEPAKWAAKLRALKTDQNRLLLKINLGAGHGGASGRYDSLRETAFEYAFILDALGMDK